MKMFRATCVWGYDLREAFRQYPFGKSETY